MPKSMEAEDIQFTDYITKCPMGIHKKTSEVQNKPTDLKQLLF